MIQLSSISSVNRTNLDSSPPASLASLIFSRNANHDVIRTAGFLTLRFKEDPVRLLVILNRLERVHFDSRAFVF